MPRNMPANSSQKLFGWHLSLCRQASNISEPWSLPVYQARVSCDPIVPHDNRAGSPSDPALDILTQRNMLIEEPQQRVAPFPLVPDY